MTERKDPAMTQPSHDDLAWFVQRVERVLNDTSSTAAKLIGIRRALVELQATTEHRVHPITETCSGLACGCQG